jgi:membrane-bound lytic murein transglycosylase B
MITRRLLCAGAALAPFPLAFPAAAQTSGPRFPPAFLEGIRQEAARAGVDRGTIDAALADIREVPRVMEQARNQPEFKMSWETYRDRVVSTERVTRGRALLAENRATIERFAGPAGLPPSVAVALWGIESNYGTRLGDFEVVEALATLVHNNFRAKFFREQLIAALKIVSQGHIGLHAMKGSWAGAMGQCQFIPTSFIAYAADGDGDGRKDIWTNKVDVFASIVNYLRKVGWRPGLRWGDEIPPGAQGGAGTRIVRPAGAGGPAYATTENFKVILRWNQSDFFALAVGLLSDRIAA